MKTMQSRQRQPCWINSSIRAYGYKRTLFLTSSRSGFSITDHQAGVASFLCKPSWSIRARTRIACMPWLRFKPGIPWGLLCGSMAWLAFWNVLRCSNSVDSIRFFICLRPLMKIHTSGPMSQMSKFISGTDILNPHAEPPCPCESELGCFRGRFISPPRSRNAAGRSAEKLVTFRNVKGSCSFSDTL